jgi:hypothetical protein
MKGFSAMDAEPAKKLLCITASTMVNKQPFTGLQSPMRFKPPNCKRLQGAAPVK